MKIQLSDHFTYKRLLRFTLPSIVMMIFTSIYGVVDGIFVSNFVGKGPFAALNLIMPYIMLFGTFGFMLGTGGTALISMTLGMGDKKRANELFSMLTGVCIIGGLVLTAVSLLFLRPAAVLLGAEGQMVEDCVTYGIIVQSALTAYVLQFAFQSFCVAAERPTLALIMTVASGVCNIVLDVLFVAVFRWGLVGAAAATAISQVVGGVIPLAYFARPNSSLLRLGKCRFYGKELLRACINGSSEMVSNLSLSLIGMLYNVQLLRYAGENGIAAYGVMLYVNLFFLSLFIGFSTGTAPIIGYNHGADNRPELKSIFRKSLILLTTFAAAMLLSAQLLAKPLAEVFVGYDRELFDMTVRGFRIYSVYFLICGFNIFGGSMFTAFNNGLISAVISFLRTLVCQIAAVILLPMVWGVDGIWWSVVVAELSAFLLTAGCFVKYRDRYHYA